MKLPEIEISYKNLFYTFFIIFIGFIYIPFISFMPNDWFRDRDNYIVYAQSSNLIMDSYQGLALYFNEPLFLILNHFLSLFFKPEIIPYFFVVFFVTVFFIALSKYSKNSLTFLFGILLSITIPYMLQSELVALRQSLGTAILILSFMLTKNVYKTASIIFICCFIHSIFFIFFFIYCLNFVLLKNLDINKKLFINFIIMVFISIFSIALAKFFGLRQGEEYKQNMAVGGGGAFILFVFIFLYLLFWGNKEKKELFEFSMIGLIMFLTAYFLTPIAGRLFNTVAPFVIFLLVSKSRLQDLAILSLMSLVFLILFFLGSYGDLLSISNMNAIENFSIYIINFFKL